jgi:SAM-dependent methyltransferase
LAQYKPDPLSTLDLVEALQLAHAVAALHDLGVFSSLAQPSSADELAKKHKLDAALLRGTLHYLAARTDLIRKTGSRFVVTRNYSRGARFLLDLYALAYGSNAVRLAELLRKPSRARDAVDRKSFARAFETAPPQPAALPAIIRQLGFRRVLDLGCGAATLLIALAREVPELSGWGVELDPTMCKTARANVRKARLHDRIHIFEGNAMHPRTAVPREVRAEADALVAAQLANELFGSGTRAAVAWLRRLRQAFPSRPLLIADYYGRLGTGNADLHRETWLHDYAQLISGQGVPPPTRKHWQELYTSAGCRLVHVLEDKRTTLFVHLVMLEE